MNLRPLALLTLVLLLLASAGVQATAHDTQAPQPSPSAQATADEGSASSVLEKYASAIGGRPLLARITTQVSLYQFTLLGRTMSVRTTTKAPSFFLQETQAEGGTGKIVIGFDGKTAWTQGPDGVTKILTGDERAGVISDAAGGNDSEIIADRWPTTVTLKPSETHSGVAYLVLSVTPKDGDSRDILLDPKTYRPVIERAAGPKVTVISVVNTFSQGPMGELQGQSITTSRSDGFPPITATLQFVRDNGAVDNAIFSPPLGKGETI